MAKLHVVTGPMFSGKTEFLLQRIKRAKYANQQIQIFVPAADTRNGIGKIVSHAGTHLDGPATAISSSVDFSKRIRQGTNLIILDEVQFISDGEILYKELELILDRDNLDIYAAGLDRDFANRPFGVIPLLMALANKVVKLTAICVVCGQDANNSYRKVSDDQVVLIGGSNLYEARCTKCFKK